MWSSSKTSRKCQGEGGMWVSGWGGGVWGQRVCFADLGMSLARYDISACTASFALQVKVLVCLVDMLLGCLRLFHVGK